MAEETRMWHRVMNGHANKLAWGLMSTLIVWLLYQQVMDISFRGLGDRYTTAMAAKDRSDLVQKTAEDHNKLADKIHTLDIAVAEIKSSPGLTQPDVIRRLTKLEALMEQVAKDLNEIKVGVAGLKRQPPD